jgi:uncharacterized protein YkwD
MSRRVSRRLAVVGLGVAAFLAGVDTALYILRKKPPVQREAAIAVDPAAIAQRAVDLANSERTAVGLDAMTTPDNLKECSRIRVGYMASHHTIEHEGEGGSLGAQGILDAWGVPYVSWGENTGRLSLVSDAPADTMHQAWMGSALHKANILDPRFTRIGVSVQPGDDGELYACMVFCREVED